jgi:hypothetical protein
MTLRRLLPASLVTVGSLVIAAPIMLPPTAHAAPVFDDANTWIEPTIYAGTNGSGCTVTPTGPAPATVPVPENGPAVTATNNYSVTYGNTNNVSDVAAMSATATGTAKVSSNAGALRSVDLVAEASARIDYALGDSPCERYYSAGSSFLFTFTVARTGFLTMTLHIQGTTYGGVSVQRLSPTDPPLSVINDGQGDIADGRVRVLLAPGTYEGNFWVNAAEYEGEGPSIRSGTLTAHGEFVLAGAQTAPSGGQGGRYVNLPMERSCASQSLAPSITGKGRRARTIRSVVFLVNGAKVRKVSSPAKGRVITLPVAAASAANLLAVVTLEPRRPGRRARVFEVTAAYEACSGRAH